MDTHGLAAVMNNTKWDELRLAMYSLGPLHPSWRTKDIETGFIPEWDGEWEIKVTSTEQDEAVANALRAIHVPGERTEHGYRVFGYTRPGKPVDYIV